MIIPIRPMSFDYGYVNELFVRHPAWRLLRMDPTPLIISFLQRTYIEPNRLSLPADKFTKLLAGELYTLRQQQGHEAFPREASNYLADWVSKGLLRNTWAGASDEPHIDMTPRRRRRFSGYYPCGNDHLLGQNRGF
jgi:hypothetical protein